MSVKIRLARHGAKKRPFYRIVAADRECPRDGKFLEKLGTYNPVKEPVEVTVNLERVKYWLDQGAIATNTVRTILEKKETSNTSS
jgi:small subunit ribosomal protein S16